MKTSQRGIDFIKSFEGFSPTIYKCPAGLDTIGFGHVVKKGEKFDKLTESQATDLLANDLIYYESKVLGLVDVPISQGQMDALVSFAYNAGPNALANSTLLKLLNAGKSIVDVSNEFLKWNKVAGKPLAGLTRRREAERDMFLGA
jgi:lysozyme